MNSKILHFINSNIFILTICLIFGFVRGFYLRTDFFWDFMNYHYYNAFAFLNNRLNYDVVLASINTFFNPLMDIPLYIMIQHLNDYPGIIYGIQGLYYGICLFFLIKICGLIWNNNSWYGLITSLLVAILASTGQAVWSQIASCTNEIQVATFAFAGLYVLFKIILHPEQQKGYKFLGGGLLLGLALGLKPTVITYCLSSGLTCIIFHKKLNRPLLYIFLFALGGLIGYLLTNGWFMWRYWELYQNPFFPFANSVFKSEYMEGSYSGDDRFFPPLKYLPIYPFIWYFGDYHICETTYYDCKLTVIYLFLILFAYKYFTSDKYKRFMTKYNSWAIYFVFLTISYLLWMSLFSILRYALIIEMFGSIFIAYATINLYKKVVSDRRKYHLLRFIVLICCVLLISVLVSTVRATKVYNINYSKHYLEIEHFKFPDNTIIKTYSYPVAAYIAEWGKDNKIRALGFNQIENKSHHNSDFAERGKFRQMREDILKDYKGPAIILYLPFSLFKDKPVPHLDEVNRITSKEIKEHNLFCRKIKNNLGSKFQICVPQELKQQILGDDPKESDDYRN